MTVDRDLLGGEPRADLLRFCGDVFGWEELPMLTTDRKRLVLSAWTHEQFVFLHGSDDPMRCSPEDHFGLSVGSLEELEEMRARALEFAEGDDRVTVTGQSLEDYGALKLHSFYVTYLLPLTIEVQHFEYPD
jgi:hypothetical protein